MSDLAQESTSQQGPILSARAADEIRSIIQQQGLPPEQTSLRVGVKGGGCGGFSYILDLTEETAGENDEQLQCAGIRMLVDNISLLYLGGVEIDFKDEVVGQGFVFKNPNPTSTCGCGSSLA